MIQANLTHFIASDAHNIHNRTFKMEEAMDFIEKKYGIDMVYYFTENAEMLVDGKNIYKEIPELIKEEIPRNLLTYQDTGNPKVLLSLVNRNKQHTDNSRILGMSPYRYHRRHSVTPWVKGQLRLRRSSSVVGCEEGLDAHKY